MRSWNPSALYNPGMAVGPEDVGHVQKEGEGEQFLFHRVRLQRNIRDQPAGNDAFFVCVVIALLVGAEPLGGDPMRLARRRTVWGVDALALIPEQASRGIPSARHGIDPEMVGIETAQPEKT